MVELEIASKLSILLPKGEVQGGSQRESGKVLNIGEDTIDGWIRLHKAGDLKAKKRTDFPVKVP